MIIKLFADIGISYKDAVLCGLTPKHIQVIALEDPVSVTLTATEYLPHSIP